MFHSLRNRLILINLAITTIVLVVAFSTIYMIARSSLKSRPPVTVNTLEYSTTVVEVVQERVISDRRATLDSLLTSLITTGIMVELAVAIASYFWAEAAIHPIKEAYESQKTFIANASHEIKTPLAAISANLEAADIQDNRWIDNISREVQALTCLNRDLLALAKIDASSVTVTSQPAKPVALAPLIQSVTSDFEARLSAKKINLQVSLTPAKPRLTAVRADLEQLLGILLDNAIKYCDHEIRLTYQDRKLSLQNDGQTIPPSDLPHIFERFYQTDKSSSGVGLGLAIASAIAKRNHWQLSADSDQNFTTFTIEF